ncbi:MAG TPA: ribonuclease III [Blastocatellia bacterium]|nr:ribonuclease III [Blastocatellia bacterium]
MTAQKRRKPLKKLQERIGYNFNNRRLLDRALTHRSFAHERTGADAMHNEALEFLGDSVLGFVISAWLIEKYPKLTEGRLSKIKAFLVSAANLVDHSENVGLGAFLRLNRGEEKTGGRQKRALLVDGFEALIGAVYLDGGIEEAESFIRRQFAGQMNALDTDKLNITDYKSALQERLQSENLPTPQYVVIETLGPDHHRLFRVELRVNNKALSTGEGPAIKVAHQEAARVALKKLEENPHLIVTDYDKIALRTKRAGKEARG